MSIDITLSQMEMTEVFDTNTTHNLAPMWRQAGLYEALYMSEGKRAGDLLPELKAGLVALELAPEHFGRFSAQNGWGTYEQALPWLRELVQRFEEFPDAVVGVCK